MVCASSYTRSSYNRHGNRETWHVVLSLTCVSHECLHVDSNASPAKGWKLLRLLMSNTALMLMSADASKHCVISFLTMIMIQLWLPTSWHTCCATLQQTNQNTCPTAVCLSASRSLHYLDFYPSHCRPPCLHGDPPHHTGQKVTACLQHQVQPLAELADWPRPAPYSHNDPELMHLT